MRSLFTVFSKLLHRHSEVKYAQHDTSTSLANGFVLFFGEKIRKIRHDFDQVVILHSASDNCTAVWQLRIFTPVSSDELLSIIGSTSPKSCDLDSVPSYILKCLFSAILPTINKIANLSLETGRMPKVFKEAILRPLLKTRSLDANEFKNYRPISNLRFISKIVETCVAKQLIQYLDNNGLSEPFQSAYKRNHSTETALIRVYNDIATAIDQQNSVILLLLDLSAAFDTVDHNILLSRLSNCFGITGTVYRWSRLMILALLLMFSSLVYPKDLFLVRYYIQCTHPLLVRLLYDIRCSIIFTLMILSCILRSRRHLFVTWNAANLNWLIAYKTSTDGCFLTS